MTGGLKGAKQPTQIGTFPILEKLNYQVWASRMRLHPEGLELWDAIKINNVARKKDQQVMSIFFSMISDEVTRELDVEKKIQENAEHSESEKRRRDTNLQSSYIREITISSSWMKKICFLISLERSLVW